MTKRVLTMLSPILSTEGKRNIVHLSGPKGLEISAKRTDGYRRALKEKGIALSEENIVRCDSMEATREVPARYSQSHIHDPMPSFV